MADRHRQSSGLVAGRARSGVRERQVRCGTIRRRRCYAAAVKHQHPVASSGDRRAMTPHYKMCRHDVRQLVSSCPACLMGLVRLSTYTAAAYGGLKRAVSCLASARDCHLFGMLMPVFLVFLLFPRFWLVF